MPDLHPILKAAAKGELPPWAQVDDKRYAHMRRVADLMGNWAAELGKSRVERERWRAVAFLHDALKNASNRELRIIVPERFARMPGPVLHGPAVAVRLRVEGVRDRGVLKAVTYHTLGHFSLGRIGKALYAADFLEPGRNLRNKWRAGLRASMPEEFDEVVREILRARIQHLLVKGRPIRRETFGFWNRLAGGPSWVRASEV
jgi:2-amino-4-hydroxy-6-hydroxymethyldihydropteridine diphosphokinase